MGGKGGGGGNYYQQPPDTSGYGTPEEAKLTLANEKPLDMSNYQQTINVKKQAADATAKERPPPGGAVPVNIDTDTGNQLAEAIVKPPEYWAEQERMAALRPRAIGKSSGTTTQT